MSPRLVAAPAALLSLALSAPAVAQGASPPAPPPPSTAVEAPAAPAPAPAAAPAPAPAPGITAAEREALRAQLRKEILSELDERLLTAKEEMRDEVRASVTSANVGQDFDAEWTATKPKLEFFELHGYFRTRMDVFDNFDLNTGRDPSGRFIFPVDPAKPDADTLASANLRLRLEPTLNVSEAVRVKMQVDVFDNLLMGSTPEGGFNVALGDTRTPTVVFSQAQQPPRYGVNAVVDSINVKRAWGEVLTPVGELRFGRMGSQWGLGILSNDGNCLDCDNGDTVDRILFATKIANHLIVPAVDFVSEGPSSADPDLPFGQPFDRSQLDDARNWILAIARRDKDEEIRNLRVAGQNTFINYGVYFVYRTQAWDAPNLQVYAPGNTSGHGNAGGGASLGETFYDCDDYLNGGSCEFVPREAWAVIPDLWFRLLYKSWRLELEAVAIQGEIGNRSVLAAPAALDPAQGQSLSIAQYGFVVQNELKLVDDKLSLGLEIGFASGDSAPGFGNDPGRVDPNSDVNPFPQKGDWEGQQFQCAKADCEDDTIENFRFDRDYRVDMILFREILGGVTDATYVKPSVRYDVTEGLNLNLAIVYSQANEGGSTPTGDLPLGVEIDTGINYLTRDGFVAGVRYGVLFPLSGLGQIDRSAADPTAAEAVLGAEAAQAVRGTFAVTY